MEVCTYSNLVTLAEELLTSKGNPTVISQDLFKEIIEEMISQMRYFHTFKFDLQESSEQDEVLDFYLGIFLTY